MGDANTPGTNDLSDLFLPGALGVDEVTVTPEPASLLPFSLGVLGLIATLRRRH